MAYTDEQKRQHILELQAYLHGISHQSQLPHLIPDGVYGENTANAVRLFQQQNQLPPTGETDTATWNAIAQAYRQEVRPTVLHLRLFPTGITAYAPGDKGSVSTLLKTFEKEVAKIQLKSRVSTGIIVAAMLYPEFLTFPEFTTYSSKPFTVDICLVRKASFVRL